MKTRANVLPGKYIFGTRYPPFPSAPANVVLSDIVWRRHQQPHISRQMSDWGFQGGRYFKLQILTYNVVQRFGTIIYIIFLFSFSLDASAPLPSPPKAPKCRDSKLPLMCQLQSEPVEHGYSSFLPVWWLWWWWRRQAELLSFLRYIDYRDTVLAIYSSFSFC